MKVKLYAKAAVLTGYGVKPLDPGVMSAVVLTLAAIGLAACVPPARRATRVDPVMVLREQ